MGGGGNGCVGWRGIKKELTSSTGPSLSMAAHSRPHSLDRGLICCAINGGGHGHFVIVTQMKYNVLHSISPLDDDFLHSFLHLLVELWEVNWVSASHPFGHKQFRIIVCLF
jgi:hypothetical protein